MTADAPAIDAGTAETEGLGAEHESAATPEATGAKKITASVVRGDRGRQRVLQVPPSVLQRERGRALPAGRITFRVSVLHAVTDIDRCAHGAGLC
jgi:hypothetical protein